jgi:hypothetical protein
MTAVSAVRWHPRFAGNALLAFALLAVGCGRPPDEAWLRVLHFEKNGTVVSSVASIVYRTTTITTTTSTSTTTALGTTDYVNVVFANQSTVLGTGSKETVADGVTVDQVRITYAIDGYSPPDATAAVTFFVPAGTSATASSLEVALVSTAMKSWLADTVPKSVIAHGLRASARLVFHARTDAGGELETEAGIGIVFQNTSER